MLTLGELQPGQSCRIKKLNLEGQTCQRLLSMGFLPGVEITIIRNAPLLDPFDIMVTKPNRSR
jgi:ferrous iron transport protein A